MSDSDPVVAILLADIHLQLNPPACRREEPDWFGTMARTLEEISLLSVNHSVPILCAGDVFDRWNSPAELIHFAIEHLPDMFGIPGQHDLPLHRYDLMHRSAYGTLSSVGNITDLAPGEPRNVGRHLVVQGFPWGTTLEPCSLPQTDALNVALVHSFLWLGKETGYPGAPESGRVNASKKNYLGWDAVVYGDNHKGFNIEVEGVSVLNCGTVFRRTTSEEGYRPYVGLLRSSSYIDLHYLDIEQDVLVASEAPEKWSPDANLSDFVESLQALGGDPLDFRAAMGRAIRTCNDGVGDVLLEIMQ